MNYFPDIEKAIGRIVCGSEHGTAFLISEQLLITAEHVVREHIDNPNEKITVQFPNLPEEEFSTEAELVKADGFLDIALLRLSSPIAGAFGLNLVRSRIPYNEHWETYGFAVGKWNVGARLHGYVQRAQFQNETSMWDMDLVPEQTLEQAEGLSGSPVIIDDSVQGVLIAQLDGTLGAISIEKMKGFLDENDIHYETILHSDDLPEGIRASAKKSVLNFPVIQQLEQQVLKQRQGFLFLKGNPGSGKTIISATFKPVSGKIEICGKYFIRNDQDDIPVSYRVSEFIFAEWLMSVTYRILHNTVPPKRERLLHDWIADLSKAFQELSTYYARKNQTGVFVIDGVDDLHLFDKMMAFFSMLPEKLPDHIMVIISCQSKEILPSYIQSQISIDREIEVVALSINSCRYYISREATDIQLTQVLVQSIAEKSEGHPLYLRYLVEYIKQFESVQEIEKWIKQAPTFDGEIGKYYEAIWHTIKNNEHEIWILATLARMRQGIDHRSLEYMVPPEAKYVFLTVIPKIRHLLTNTEAVGIYHSSFAMFINEKTSLLEEQVHKAIGTFCLDNPGHSYAVKNVVFHLLRAGDDLRRQAVIHCNQAWADECAKWHVAPDLILEDLHQVLGAAITFGDITELINLLLLSQRIEFRYNNIFAAYASELANVLITVGKSKDAIGYIIRESVLIVSDSDALHFLHRLYETDALEEAEQLYKAIHLRFVFEADNGAVSYRTLKLYYRALTITTTATADDPVYKFSQAFRTLSEMSEINEPDDRDSFNVLIQDIVAYNRGYLLWETGIYIPIEEYEGQGIVFFEGITTILCRMLIHLDRFETWGKSPIETSLLDGLLHDIQYVMGRYGIDEDDKLLILVALSDVNFNVNTIEMLIKDIGDGTKALLSLRKSNGVDLNYESILKHLDAWRYMGFIDGGENYPVIPDPGMSGWERYYEGVLSFTGYMLGKAWKTRASMSEDRLINVAAAAEQYLLPKLIIPFKVRVGWERSYALPESLCPYLIKQIVSFYLTYCVEQLPTFIRFIEDHSSDQLGLYTEGFREALFVIIGELAKTKQHVKSAFTLLKIIENHITLGVQNRWERSRDLLRIAELYANIGSEERSSIVFQNMLDTSMGPSWYKEDQLTLIGTSMHYLQKSAMLPLHLIEIAGHLDYASGEMTFQRYVRQQKEDFIGKLCSMGRVKQAVEYYQDSVLPSPEKVLRQAESPQIDSPEAGQGYIFGAAGLDEQSCILEMIENTSNVKGFLKWALCELFLIGDDRYFLRFARIMSDLLNEREASNSDELQLFSRRLLRLLISDMSPDKRVEFLSHLKNCLSERNYGNLLTLLKKSGLNSEQDDAEQEDPLQHITAREHDVVTNQEEQTSSEENDSELFFPGTFGKTSSMHQLEEQMHLAQEQLDIENIQYAKKHFVTGLENAQSGAWNVWTSNSGADVLSAFEMLSTLSTDVPDFVRSVRGLILNEAYTPDWLIVNKLITCVGGNLDSTEAGKLFLAVLEHIRFMLRTPEEALTKYEWFENEKQTTSNNIMLTKLLIGLLDHPKNIIKYRAPEILKWLSKADSSYFVPFLIYESLFQSTGEMPEICSGILHSLALEDASLVWEYLQAGDSMNQIAELEHFMIKYTFLEIAKLASNENVEAAAFHKQLIATFNTDVSLDTSSEEVGKPDWMKHINSMLEPLEEIGVVGSSDYQKLDWLIDRLSLPLTREELMRVDRYIARGFNIGQNAGLLENTSRRGINQFLSKKTSPEDMFQVADILRTYNPYFPNENIRLESKTGLLSIIEELISDERDDYEICTEEGAYDYLHYFETIFVPEEDQLKLIEVIGFLAGPDAFQRPFRSKEVYEIFFSNEQPDFQDISSSAILTYRPAIYKVAPLPDVFGGIMTPAFLHPHFEGLLGEFRKQDIIRENWLEGRSWDVDRMGIPVREGCRLLITKEKIKRLKLTPWRLVWLVKYDETTSFIIDRENRAIYPYEQEDRKWI